MPSRNFLKPHIPKLKYINVYTKKNIFDTNLLLKSVVLTTTKNQITDKSQVPLYIYIYLYPRFGTPMLTCFILVENKKIANI